MAGALSTAATVSVAAARVVAAPDGRGGTALPVLAGCGPLALRRVRGGAPAEMAEVALVGAMAGPLGGDRLAVTATVEPGAQLRVTSVAATISLPGPGPAHYELDLTVGEGALLEWLPEPVVAAAGSHLLLTTRVTLAAGARLRLREEQILGRRHDWSTHGVPGRLTSRLTVRQAGRLILDQQTDLGPGAPGWAGPAVLAGHRATGQLLTVGLPSPVPAPESAPESADCALLTLAGAEARLLVAVAADGLSLRRSLAAGA